MHYVLIEFGILVKPVAESVRVGQTFVSHVSYSEWFETRKCFIVIDFKICCGIYHSSFESVEQFEYLRTTLKNQNSIQGEINSRLKSGSTCYRAVQNLLSSSLLSKNIKSNISTRNKKTEG